MKLQEIIERVKEEGKSVDAIFCSFGFVEDETRECLIIDYLARKFYEKNDMRIPWTSVLRDKKFRREELEELSKYHDEIKETDHFVYDEDHINSLLGKDYVYIIDGWKGKPTFFIGEIKKHEKLKDIDIYTIGKELVSTSPIEEEAIYRDDKKIILLRTFPTKLFVWRKLDNLKNPRSEMHKNFVKKTVSYITDVKPTEFTDEVLEEAVERLSRIMMRGNLAHEIGHYGSGSKCPIVKNEDLDRFVISINDSVADSYLENDLEGRIAFINNRLNYKEKLGILSLIISNYSEEKMMLQRELVYAYRKLIEREDKNMLEEARKAIWERNEKLSKEVIELFEPKSIILPDDYATSQLRKMKIREEIEYEKVEEEMIKLMEVALTSDN